MDYYLVALLSYLLGSIPFGFLLTKIFLKKDIRDIGSGNIGATNVLRGGNKVIGFATLILDISKAILPVIFVKFNFPNLIYIASLCAFLGHLFPIWLKFKGGKGVATYIGIVTSINFTFGIITCMIWLLSAVIFRVSSLSALIAAIFGPFLVYFFMKSSFFGMSILLTCLIFFTHRQNIRRILNGTETRINVK